MRGCKLKHYSLHPFTALAVSPQNVEVDPFLAPVRHLSTQLRTLSIICSFVATE